MTVMPILEVPDPRLRVVSKPVETFDDALRTLVADMFETMYDAPGIGLAAIQVGEEKRLLVIDLQEEEDEDGKPIKDPQVFVNPEILETSDEVSTYKEGCLSIPEQFADVERPARCKARWQDEHGETHEAELDGLMATCLQHEIDHLNGVVFTDHLSRLKRDMVLKKLAKMRKAAA
ncbi:peptide deformylase [Stakelama marina]|uniref:Peptide deformylase n=1 Tax=Stakelama marina TaxID=2826939 RepID=A0A8T4ICS0_9SPHN|nr:peptide deformylase [Stakelama marina]MBR0551644.1 peptide deformylase [Stakelama marina]